jgi:hypothetical protein
VSANVVMRSRDPDWKEKLIANLQSLGLMKSGFTGQLIIDCNQGGVTAFTISEKIR